ncbi:traf2 and NCK-interacting protein kinase-like [Tachysurus ichikawai]
MSNPVFFHSVPVQIGSVSGCFCPSEVVEQREAYIHSNQIMGWGEKAIEIRSVETGHLDGVFMHKRAQRLKFLSERNDKVFFASVRSGGSSQVFFMTLNRNSMMNW